MRELKMERNFFYRDKFNKVHLIKTWEAASDDTKKEKIPYSICRSYCNYLITQDPIDSKKGLCCLFKEHLKHKNIDRSECFRCSKCISEEDKLYKRLHG